MTPALAHSTLSALRLAAPFAVPLVLPLALSAHDTAQSAAHRGYASVLAALGRTA